MCMERNEFTFHCTSLGILRTRALLVLISQDSVMGTATCSLNSSVTIQIKREMSRIDDLAVHHLQAIAHKSKKEQLDTNVHLWFKHRLWSWTAISVEWKYRSCYYKYFLAANLAKTHDRFLELQDLGLKQDCINLKERPLSEHKIFLKESLMVSELERWVQLWLSGVKFLWGWLTTALTKFRAWSRSDGNLVIDLW